MPLYHLDFQRCSTVGKVKSPTQHGCQLHISFNATELIQLFFLAKAECDRITYKSLWRRVCAPYVHSAVYHAPQLHSLFLDYMPWNLISWRSKQERIL